MKPRVCKCAPPSGCRPATTSSGYRTNLVYERHAEYWTSRQIEQFFTDRGFKCEALPIHAGIEKQVPADFAFSSSPPTKLFGLQYKVLYQNGHLHWKLDRTQHRQIAKFPWIYYGLSELESAADRSSALHALRLKPARFQYAGTLGLGETNPYSRWWPFFKGLLRCTIGSPIRSREALADALSSDTVGSERLLRELAHLFLLDAATQRLIIFRETEVPDDLTP